MRGIKLLFVFLASSLGIVAESPESFKILDNTSTSVYQNPRTQNIQGSSLDEVLGKIIGSNDAANNTITTSAPELNSKDSDLWKNTSGGNGSIANSKFSNSSSSLNAIAQTNTLGNKSSDNDVRLNLKPSTPEKSNKFDSPKESAVEETNKSSIAPSDELINLLSTTLATNLRSSGDVSNKLLSSVFNNSDAFNLTLTANSIVKSTANASDSEGSSDSTTISNIIPTLTSITINSNNKAKSSVEAKFVNQTITRADIPSPLTIPTDTFNVNTSGGLASSNKTTEQSTSFETQPNSTVTNRTNTTTEEATSDNSTLSTNQLKTPDVPRGGNTTDNTSRTNTEYRTTSSETNTTSENETISSLTTTNSTETVTTSTESSENSTLLDLTTSPKTTDRSVPPENTSVNPNSTVTSNHSDTITETAGNTTISPPMETTASSSQGTSTSTYTSTENDIISDNYTSPSVESTISSSQNSTLPESTTPITPTTITEVSNSSKDATLNMTTVSSTDDVENITYSPTTSTESGTTVSSNSSSESTEDTASSDESSSTASEVTSSTTEDLSSDVPNSSTTNNDKSNTTTKTTQEVTTQTYPSTASKSTIITTSQDTTFAESTNTLTTTSDTNSSMEITTFPSTSTSEMQTSDIPRTTSTTSTTEHTTITKLTTTQSSTVTAHTTTDGIPETTSKLLGPPLNQFTVTDKNGITCIIFRVRLELLISYSTKSGAITDGRLNVPTVDKFEGACGIVDQYIRANWTTPKGGTNQILFSMKKSADNSSYTLKLIKVDMILDEVNFPDAAHTGLTLSEEIEPNFYSIPTGRGLKCATRKGYVGTNVTMIASDVELLAFNEQQDVAASQYGGCPLAAAPTLQPEEIAAIAVGAVLALVTASLATAFVFRKRRSRTNKFYLSGSNWA